MVENSHQSRQPANQTVSNESVIVAGSRAILDLENGEQIVRKTIEQAPFSPNEIVSGAARGVDEMGESWASEHGIPVKQFEADWNEHDRAAGPIRNAEMAEYADALIAVRVDNSAGTTDMIEKGTEKLGEENVYVREIKT